MAATAPLGRELCGRNPLPRVLLPSGYQDVCKRLTKRQRRALHCYHDRKTDSYVAPSASTFYRILRLIEPAHFESIVSGWLLEQEIGQLERLAVDGKVLRGTGREDGKPLALLSVVSHLLRTTLRSVQIGKKSNEPTEGR